jgi:hypothetical protein
VLAPNGNVIFVPYDATTIGNFDPIARSFQAIDISSMLSADNIAWKYYGGVLAPSGKVVLVPFNANEIGEYDPVSRTLATIDISDSVSSSKKYRGGVLAPSGRILFVPFNADNIGLFDPSSQTFTTIDISSTISEDKKFWGGVLGPNMKAYLVPHNANVIGELEVGNLAPAYEVANGVPESWKPLLSPLTVIPSAEYVDVVNGHGAGPVEIGEGTHFWSDRTYELWNVPVQLLGGLLYQFPHRNSNTFSISVNKIPAHVYILYDDGRAGGLDAFLSNNGWRVVSPASFAWKHGNAYHSLFYGVKLVSTPTSFSFPSTSSERLMGVVIV